MIESFSDYTRYDLIEDKAKELPNSTYEQKAVMVLCKHKDLTGPNRDLLNKILGAIGQDESNTNIIGVDDHELIDVTDLLRRVPPETLLSFEINLNKNGLNLEQKLYRRIPLMSTTVIISEALETLQGSKDKKMKLWTCLKEHFNVSQQ